MSDDDEAVDFQLRVKIRGPGCGDCLRREQSVRQVVTDSGMHEFYQCPVVGVTVTEHHKCREFQTREVCNG